MFVNIVCKTVSPLSTRWQHWPFFYVPSTNVLHKLFHMPISKWLAFLNFTRLSYQRFLLWYRHGQLAFWLSKQPQNVGSFVWRLAGLGHFGSLKCHAAVVIETNGNGKSPGFLWQWLTSYRGTRYALLNHTVPAVTFHTQLPMGTT